MAKKRDPKREQAFEIWKNSGGTKKLNEIAEELGISSGTVRGWKNKDAWEEKLNGTFQLNERNVPKKETERSKKKRGAPLGNKNAVGNRGGGAPLGNKNAVGNKGGAAPLRNTNAMKTGEFASLWYDALDDEEKAMLDRIDVIEPVQQIIEEIKLYTFREAVIMSRIKAIKEGMTSAQKRVLRELRKVKDKVEVEDPIKGGYRIIERENYKMMETAIEEIEADPIARLLDHEEALTRVQDKKVKAIKSLFEMTSEFEHKKLMDEIKTTVLQEKWEKEKGEEENKSDSAQQWVDALQSIFEKRKAKR
ncbi:ATPase subunit of terminase family protein (plasmid) [Anoxybacillus sp. B7M1]|uniref:phage terminase small subunit-related protein n=1 Tax=Anoxybacillus sp. B7M1 TaxID=1490057 RepID=UPI0005CD83E6|nr:phage terminase small subunit-related protein [Anoxybacillus sp. B7M1]ANB66109.1 ATPase subunit of terminase family protein [Anoxybacillus sp. B7M1]